MVIELRIAFRSFEEWSDWKQSQGVRLRKVEQDIVEDARTRGLIEPITGKYCEPEDIVIDPTRLQVSLTAGQLNSRKRAGLAAVDIAISSLAPAEQRNPKILGCEAVTRVAAILKYRFPYYLGTEFLPTPEEKLASYPLSHLDLMAIAHPPESFDVFFSAHVLEHVPLISAAIRQIAAVLKPGGAMVSTFPFNATRKETLTKAKINQAGEIDYLTEPEYHGNPVRIDEGSLVFQLPGWDVLSMCADAGLVNARMLLVASSRSGIASNGAGGVFILFAQKPGAAGREVVAPSNIEYDGPYF